MHWRLKPRRSSKTQAAREEPEPAVPSASGGGDCGQHQPHPQTQELSPNPNNVNAVSPASLPYDRIDDRIDGALRVGAVNPAARPLSPEELRRVENRRPRSSGSRMQQELLRRRQAQKNLAGSGSQRVPSRSDDQPLNALVRKPSSPAAHGYVPEDLTSYGTPLKRRKALLIGISYRENRQLEDLPGCTNDVQQMFALLTSDLFGFKQDAIKVLSDELDTIGNVRAEAPTRANIIRDLTWLTEDLSRGESVVFFFAGHGDYIEDESGDEVETGYDQCLMPVDYKREPRHTNGSITFKGVTPILDDQIYERLVRAVPGGAKVTAIIDACRSGTAFDLPVMYDDGGLRFRKGAADPPRETARPHKSAGACILFSGSADHQMSADMTVPRNGLSGEQESFGIMTRSFVDTVREMASYRPHNYAGIEPWTYGEVFDRVKTLVAERVSKVLPEGFEAQEPQLSSSHKINTWETSFTM